MTTFRSRLERAAGRGLRTSHMWLDAGERALESPEVSRAQSRPSKNAATVPPESGRSLILVESGDAGLSKEQKAFNRLVRRIEKLRREIDAENRRLDSMMEDYRDRIHPLLLQVVEQRQQFIRSLVNLLPHPALKRGKLKQVLLDTISRSLDDLALECDGQLSEEFERVFERVEGCTREEFGRRQFESMRAGMQEEFADMGVQVDLSALNPNANPEEILRKLGEIEQQVRSESNPFGDASPRPKSRRQLAAEEKRRQMEEMRTKDLATLYKQLAKLLHPDLEQDPQRREEKEAAMKRLNAAYQNEDLHGLLQLEIEWTQREASDAARLSNEKLKVYNEVLKEQVAELEASLMHGWQHPRYRALARFGDPFLGLRIMDTETIFSQLQGMLRGLRAAVAALRGPGAIDEIRDLARSLRSRRQAVDPFGDRFF